MKKRVVACMLALAMVAGLAGCGNSSESEEGKQAETKTEEAGGDGTNLSVFWWGSQIRNERTQEILDMYAAEHPEITFDGQFSDDYWTRMATFAAGHTMPDIVQMIYAYMP